MMMELGNDLSLLQTTDEDNERLCDSTPPPNMKKGKAQTSSRPHPHDSDAGLGSGTGRPRPRKKLSLI
jgi:hypothetical protein